MLLLLGMKSAENEPIKLLGCSILIFPFNFIRSSVDLIYKIIVKIDENNNNNDDDDNDGDYVEKKYRNADEN